MKFTTKLSTLFLCLIFNALQAQKQTQCAFCKMTINDEFHRASAQHNGETLSFDSSECLINYTKEYNENNFSLLKVADYNTGKLIDAKTAFYLESKKISSPMGANLSAFKTEKEAVKMQSKKGGEIYTWELITAKFKDSKFGTLNHHNHYRPDAHAPIGVMGDHLHLKGSLMLSFRYMTMAMKGNKSGTNNISNNTIYNNYMVAPQHMTMEMYMLGIMYAPSNKLTVMAMQNIVKMDMDLVGNMTINGMPMLNDFTTQSSDLGDLKLGVLYSIFNHNDTSLHLNTSFNIPVGSISKRDNTPMMTNAKLPYAMQLGSGTFDITLGATFKKSCQNMSFGTQYLSTFRTSNNSDGYRFGNIHQLNIWGAYKLSKNFSTSARILDITEGKIKGIDKQLNPTVVTTANTDNYGSDKIKSFIGFNISFPSSSNFKKFKFGFEAGVPIYENYKGIQMNENLSINAGLKYDIL